MDFTTASRGKTGIHLHRIKCSSITQFSYYDGISISRLKIDWSVDKAATVDSIVRINHGLNYTHFAID